MILKPRQQGGIPDIPLSPVLSEMAEFETERQGGPGQILIQHIRVIHFGDEPLVQAQPEPEERRDIDHHLRYFQCRPAAFIHPVQQGLLLRQKTS